MSSFVKKVTYLKISKIGLDLAKKNQFEKVTDKQIDNKISKFKKNRCSDQLCEKKFKIDTDSDSLSEDGLSCTFY